MLKSLPLAANTVIHFLGPPDIQRLYSIGNDIIRLQSEEELPKAYTFHYPDLVMVRRHGDGNSQAATIESITGPYLLLRHTEAKNCSSGVLVYYNRPGSSSEEFEYFLDSLSRFQLLEPSTQIRVRVTDVNAVDDMKSNFDKAKKKYVKSWGFDPAREAILDKIEIERITSVSSTYNAGDMGWRL